MEEINLPPRMFAAGEEPCGERVIPQLREEIVPDEPFVIVESDSEGETLEDGTPTEGPPVLEDNFGRIEKLYISTKLCIIPGDAIYIGLECQVHQYISAADMNLVKIAGIIYVNLQHVIETYMLGVE